MDGQSPTARQPARGWFEWLPHPPRIYRVVKLSMGQFVRIAVLFSLVTSICLPALAFEMIIDNTDASSTTLTGSWSTITTNCYGQNKFWNPPGSGSNTFTWTSPVPPGWYRIDYWMCTNTGYATDAHYTVVHRDGTDNLIVNQRHNDGWHFLGTYYFDTTATVTLSDEYVNGTRVVADALRLQSIFSFVQMSDSHAGYTSGTNCLQLIVDELKLQNKIPMATYGFDAPPPDFGIHSGDTTEYGQEFWNTFTGKMDQLPFPVYAVMGNHDATQNCNREKMRARYGAPNYSFDHIDRGKRYHFAMLESAAIQTQFAMFSRDGLDWLATDLASLPTGTLAFVNIHHPINSVGSSELKPYDVRRFLEVLRPFNVPIVFYGHGHGANTTIYDGVRIVQGGSTYNDTTGRGNYNVITVTNNSILHIANKVCLASTAAGSLVNNEQLTTGTTYPVINVTGPVPEYLELGGTLGLNAAISGTTYSITAAEYEIDGSGTWTALSGSGPYSGSVNLTGLVHGRHWVRFRFSASGAGPWHKTVSFWTWDAYPKARWVHDLGAASLTAPALANGRLFVGTNGSATSGSLRCLDSCYGSLLWRRDLPGDVASSPAVAGDAVVFGCSDGKVYCLNTNTGATSWTATYSGPIYSPPSIDDGRVFIGSNGTGAANSAKLYCLDLYTGGQYWSFPVACAIESKPAVQNGVVYVGAWDSYFYAVNVSDGTQKWRYQRSASRYNSPANSWPVVSPAGTQVFVADRAYYQNAIDTETGLADWTSTGIASQALTSDGTELLQRLQAGPLQRITFGNAPVWSAACSLEEDPASPATSGTRVAVSNKNGLLSVVNAATGAIEWQFELGDSYHLVPVTIDGEGTVWATTYEGHVICIANQDPTANAIPDVLVEARTSGGAVTGNPPYAESGGGWGNSTAKTAGAGLSGAGSRYSSLAALTGSAQATPYITTCGTYDVYAAWCCASNARNVTFTVNHKNGSSVVTLDQKPGGAISGSNANYFNLLGRFQFVQGQNAATGSVTVSETSVTGPFNAYSTGRVYSDAFLWVYHDAVCPVALSGFAAE